jgi:hypothetical protein
MYTFRNGASSSLKESSVFLYSATFVAPWLQQEHIRSVTQSRSLWILCILCHCTILYNIYTRYKVHRGFLSMQACALSYALTCVTALKLQLSAKRSQAWPLPSLSLLCFLCLASPCQIPWTFGFKWFSITSAGVRHNLLILIQVRNYESHGQFGVLCGPAKISNSLE